VTVFDWPQAVSTDHENSDELLERDVENILGYFERKYPNETPAVDRSKLADALADGRFESVREIA
jgi:RIO kinase 2